MSTDTTALVRRINASAEFNRWAGFEVVSTTPGTAELALSWRSELGQYSGFLHASLIGGLIDTACGFAAATLSGPNLLAAHFSLNCLRPAVGERFVARARVVKPGRQQIFTACEVYAFNSGSEQLVANGETLLAVVAPSA